MPKCSGIYLSNIQKSIAKASKSVSTRFLPHDCSLTMKLRPLGKRDNEMPIFIFGWCILLLLFCFQHECNKFSVSLLSDTDNKFSLYLFVSLRYGSGWCFQRISCISSFPARMNASQSKIKEPEWSQHFFPL